MWVPAGLSEQGLGPRYVTFDWLHAFCMDFQGLYLKKHTSMGRTYTLNKKDSKMVGDAMKKKL